MVIALTEVQRSCRWRAEGRFSFILRHFKRPLGCFTKGVESCLEIQVKAILGTGAKWDDFKGSNRPIMSAEATGSDSITGGRKKEGNGKCSDLEGCLFAYGKEKTWKDNPE